MKVRRLIPLGIVALAAVVVAAVAALAASGSSDAASAQKTYKFRLGSDVRRFNDRSFNQPALEGLKRARTQLKAQIRRARCRSPQPNRR